MFVDEATIDVKAGAGGNGCVSFHRERHRPRGGPDGGDGGTGGSIIIAGDEGLRTLMDFRYRRHFKAARGQHGRGSDRDGANGEDLVLPVPVGTVVYDDEGRPLGEVLGHGERLVVAEGGLGGRGNTQFTTAQRRAPAFAEKGEPGEERRLHLELKLLADVGLIGYPNVGKSTLISRISAAKPKIADYPFTTLQPNLGVVAVADGRSFVVADMPGLISGAHQGKGLGDRFLRHVERTAILVHVIDLSAPEGRDPVTDWRSINHELASYSEELSRRPQFVVGAKLDLPDARDRAAAAEDEFTRLGVPFMAISAVAGENIETFKYRLADMVDAARAERPRELLPRRVYRLEPEEETVHVAAAEAGRWRVTGRAVERMVNMTDFDNEEAVAYLQRRLERFEIERLVAEAGARPGDDILIGRVIFEFQPEALAQRPPPARPGAKRHPRR